MILPVALCQPVDEDPVVDGKLDEAVWLESPAIPFFVRPQLRWIPEAQTQVYVCYSARRLTFAFRCFEDEPERIEIDAGPPDSNRIFHDDLIGIRLAPLGAGETEPRHFVATASGRLYEEREPGKFTPLEGAPCAVNIGADSWTVEFQLSCETHGLPEPQARLKWGFSAYRKRVGPRLESSGWIQVGPGPFGEKFAGWLLFESPQESEGRSKRPVHSYLLSLGQQLERRSQQADEAIANLEPSDCPATRYRVNYMLRSLSSIAKDILFSYHPDAMRHYAAILQYNFGRLDEYIETLRQGEDPHTSPDGYLFQGMRQEADQSHHAYAMLFCRGYDSTNLHPVVVVLHGYSDDWIADTRSFMPVAWEPGLDLVMLFPSGMGLGRNYRLAGEDEVFSLLQRAQERFALDPRRTYILGVGGGANAAYRLANRYPHQFSAVATAGPVRALKEAPGRPHYYYAGPYAGWVGPVENREEVDVDFLRTAPVGDVSAIGAEFLARLAGHVFTTPRSIEIYAPSARYGRGVWANIDKPVDYSRASRLQLEALEDGRIRGHAENVAALTIFPFEGPFETGQWLTVEIDGKTLGQAEAGSEPMQFHLTPPPTGPHPKIDGLAGPINEAFHGAQLYVTGTLASDEMNKVLRRATYQGCRWPLYDLRIPVKVDTAVTLEDMERANMHLFGGPLWNAVAARMEFQFPFEMWEGGFKIGERTYDDPGHVCQFICPNPLAPSRYVVVNIANSPEGWMHRGFFPKYTQPKPVPDLWVANIRENKNLAVRGIEPAYIRKAWFDANWRLVE